MTTGGPIYAQVLLEVPIAAAFDYLIPATWPEPPRRGDWVVVPWGKSQRIGIVSAITDQPAVAASRIKSVARRLADAPTLPASWFALGRFAADYYHRQPGEILLPAIPKLLRVVPRAASAKTGRVPVSAFARAEKKYAATQLPGNAVADEPLPSLTADQQAALQSLQSANGFQVSLLHGVTGSGKTEIYLRYLSDLLAQSSSGQVLLLVPEIALTPQLAQQVKRRLRFPVAVLHSGMAEGERAAQWLAAVQGRARIVIGTRLSVLVPLPTLIGIVVDEEHDPSFKQQEGAHYSARDLAIVRAREHKIPIILGSATPSLESWHAARRGRYQYVPMHARATGAPMPVIEIETLRDAPRAGSVQATTTALANREGGAPVILEGFCEASVQALQQCLANGDQALVFLNRRGYAPVLNCSNCEWLSECDNCSAYRVLHRLPVTARMPASGGAGAAVAYRLICHHCAVEAPVPRACPACGDLSLRPLGRGTQRIEEILQAGFAQARIGRLDRDVARRRGAADAMLESIHQGEVDIVVGTQMLAKGHDIKRLNLVIVLDADGALFSSDFRAPERLFATLTQVAGRSGRNANSDGSAPGRVIVQTRFADHPLFESLRRHDYTSFADNQLQERRDAALPPISFQALLRLEGISLEQTIRFGRQAGQTGRTIAGSPDDQFAALTVYDPVPMPMARLAGRARAQLLIESKSRQTLHRFAARWIDQLQTIKAPVRWQLEIDPSEI